MTSRLCESAMTPASSVLFILSYLCVFIHAHAGALGGLPRALDPPKVIGGCELPEGSGN